MKQYLLNVINGNKKGLIVEILKISLLVVSFVYGFFVYIRNFLFDKGLLSVRNIGRPVICVGNIVAGGVGKTPMVEYLVKYAYKKGIKPVILSRGYMASNSALVQSDEVSMLKNHLGNVEILIGANRVQNAIRFLDENEADVFIMDDGFQHRKMFRDCNILLIDATDPWGNGHLIPRGMLREPVSSINRADIVVITKSDLVKKEELAALVTDILKINKKVPVVKSVHSPVNLIDINSNEIIDLSFLKDKNICSFSSIGNAKAFEQMLSNLGANLKATNRFLDHHVYSKNDFKIIAESCVSEKVSILITTSKDAVKLDDMRGVISEKIRVLSFEVNIVITEGEDSLIERINNIL